MDPSQILRIRAILVALLEVTTQTVPPLSADLLSPDKYWSIIESWKGSNYDAFFQLYETTRLELRNRQDSQQKNKIVRPVGLPNQSINDPDNQETQNVAVSADGIEEIFLSDNPTEKIKERYQADQAQSAEPLDHYDWVDSYLWTH